MSKLTSKPILADGSLNSKIIFIGDCPNSFDEDRGRPFEGSDGQLLKRCLNQTGISKSECLFGNVFQQRPLKKNTNYYFQNKTNTKPTWEGEEHITKLTKLLSSLTEPVIIVALGPIALHVLTGKKRINKWRGSVLPCILVDGLKVYPTFHPYFVNKMMNEPDEGLVGTKKQDSQNTLPIFLLDLERIKEYTDMNGAILTERKFDTNLSFGDIIAKLTDLARLDHKEQIELSVDIETLPSNTGPILWCIGFSYTPAYAFVVPFLRGMKFCWTHAEEALILILISKIFLNKKVTKIFQNGSYDLSVLGRYYGLRVADDTFEDTMWLHHASFPYIKKGLETLTSIYTWEPYYKDEGKVDFGKRHGDQAEFIYNAKDCCVTREIFPIVQREAKKLETYNGYLRSMNILPSLLGMMLRGVKIDQTNKAMLQKDFEEKANYYAEKVNLLAEESINLNSPAQKKRLLYVTKGYPIQINHKTGKVTTDKDAIQKLKKKYPDDKILFYILEYQKYMKLSSTYANMELDTDGRIRTSYGFVSTWRLNSRESHFGGGGNLQNIPKKSNEGKMIRKLFIPDEGKVLLSVDLSQAEARVVVWEANNLPMIEAFMSPEMDVHWENTKRIFSLPSKLKYEPKKLYTDRLTKEEHTMNWYRQIGKTIKHATNYDSGPGMLQTILSREGADFPFALCKKLIHQTIASDPCLTEWKRNIREKIKANRMLISSFGRKRYFMGRLGDSLYRAAYAFSPQNTVGELTQVGIRNVWKNLSWVEILLNVHDELVMQIFPEDLERTVPAVTECFNIPLMINGRKLLIPCEFKTGNNWGDLKEINYSKSNNKN